MAPSTSSLRLHVASPTPGVAAGGSLLALPNGIALSLITAMPELAGQAVPGPVQSFEYQRARRLELAGWIVFGVGLAAILTGVIVGVTSIPDEDLGQGIGGLATALAGTLPFTIGLPMGIVGTVRRGRLAGG